MAAIAIATPEAETPGLYTISIASPHAPTAFRIDRAHNERIIAHAKEYSELPSPDTLAITMSLIDVYRPASFFDVGASVGSYALIAKLAFGERIDVHAFEPTPEVADKLRSLAAINQAEVKAHQVAVHSAEGTAYLHISNKTSGSNSLSPDHRKWKKRITVRAVTIDAAFNHTTGVLKIDTESTEEHVLRGGLNYIRTYRPWIVCEILRPSRGMRIRDMMRSLDYRFFGVRQHMSWVEEDPSEPTDCRDWLLAPEYPCERLRTAFERWKRAFRSATVDATATN